MLIAIRYIVSVTHDYNNISIHDYNTYSIHEEACNTHQHRIFIDKVNCS